MRAGALPSTLTPAKRNTYTIDISTYMSCSLKEQT